MLVKEAIDTVEKAPDSLWSFICCAFARDALINVAFSFDPAVSYQPNGGPRSEPKWNPNARAPKRKNNAHANSAQTTSGGRTALFRSSAKCFSAAAVSLANCFAASVPA
jgi:hypothetical protein